jgi:hypothetical protein
MMITGAFTGQTMAAGDRPEEPAASNAMGRESVNQAALEANYAHCLASDNDGVVESALAFAIQAKAVWPDQSYPKVEKAIRKLSVDGRTLAIRYKASLANIVYDDMAVLKVSDCRECSTAAEVFATVAAEIQQAALSVK